MTLGGLRPSRLGWAPADRSPRDAGQAIFGRGIQYGQPKTGRDALVPPAIHGCAADPKAGRHFHGAAQGGNDLARIHGGIVSELPTLRKPKPACTVGHSYTRSREPGGQVEPMAKLRRDDLVRRLKAVRAEMGLQPSELAARLAVPRTTYLGWETENPKKPNFPSEEAMMNLCDVVPGLTLDYLYRGKLATLPLGLAIRLTSREMGLDPDSPGDRAVEVMAAVAR